MRLLAKMRKDTGRAVHAGIGGIRALWLKWYLQKFN
jgi:hypothetical protein